MAKGKAGKAIIVDTLVKEIEKGAQRGEVVAKYCKKFQKSSRTIDSYWKIANEQYLELQIKAKAAADASYILASENAATRAVMSKAERLEILSNIARGDINIKTLNEKGEIIEVPVIIETLEKIKAISELKKMEGDYAPTKVAQTDKDGENVITPAIVNIYSTGPAMKSSET